MRRQLGIKRKLEAFPDGLLLRKETCKIITHQGLVSYVQFFPCTLAFLVNESSHLEDFHFPLFLENIHYQFLHSHAENAKVKSSELKCTRFC